MLAATVLAAFAAAAALYKGQQVYGRSYERRTARLRLRGENFYAAADKLLANPALDAEHIETLSVFADAVGSEKDALLWSAIMLRTRREFQRAKMTGETPSFEPSPPDLFNDAHNVTQAALLLLAEMQPIFGHPLREFASFDPVAKRSLLSKLSEAFVVACYKLGEHFFISVAVIYAAAMTFLFFKAPSHTAVVTGTAGVIAGMTLSTISLRLRARSRLREDGISRTNVKKALESARAPSDSRYQHPTHAAG